MASSRIVLVAVLVAIVGVAPAVARGDTIWIGGAAGANAIEMGGVQIQSIQEGKLTFVAAGGRESARDLGQIARVSADNEPALNAAEDALASGQLDVATDHFRKALTASAKEWVKQWSAQRLTQVAPRANRFDAAASGYIALLARDPARAAEFKPPLPPAQSTFIASAINEASNALATPTLSPASKQALEDFLVELQQGKAAAAPAGAGAAAPAGAAGAAPTPAAQPGAQAPTVAGAAVATSVDQQAARQKLDAANAALERRDFPAAINEIKSNPKIFTAARDQAQALYFIAEAQTGLARAKNDAPSWQDAALAYMRVVAHFRDAEPARPFVARSMLKAAQIHETLRDPAAARTLYDQLAKEFPADPAANDAKAALERLKASP